MNIPNFINRLLGRPPEVRSGAWDAAGGGNRLANWNATPAVVNPFPDNPVNVRAKAEGEFRNNPWSRKAVEATLAAAIGASGLKPQFRDKTITQAWEAWADQCDAGGRLDWVQLQALILQTVIVSGEAFVRFLVDPEANVPLALQVLGPEYLDTSRADGQTVGGIQYDGTRRAGYWLYERHPALTAYTPSVFVPASQVLHIFKPVAPGAERGVSWLAPVLLVLRELQEFTEAALVRQKVAALFCGYVRTEDGSNPLAPANGVPTMEPGAMTRLKGNELVDFTEPPDAGATFDPFVRAMLRKIAAGANVPYEILSGDLSAVTFASGRHGLLEWRRHIEAIQHALMVPQFCAPVLARWMQIATALGVIPAPAKARWIGPQVGMLDENAETTATIKKIRAGLTSRAEAVSATGWNIEDIDAELAADNARADRLGLVLDSDPRRVAQQGQIQAASDGAQTAA